MIFYCQLLGLGLTLLVSIILGAATGLFISMKKLFETIPDDQLFDDEVGGRWRDISPWVLSVLL